MSVTLALLLAVPLCGGMVSEPATFEEMLDSAQIVVIGKADSIWYRIDTITLSNGTKAPRPHTYVSAEVLTFFTKDTNFVLPFNSIHLAYLGGKVGPDRYIRVYPSPKFEEGELFLAAVEKHPFLYSEEEHIFQLPRLEWKYTIANDSLCMGGEGILPLGKALEGLSEAFVEYEK